MSLRKSFIRCLSASSFFNLFAIEGLTKYLRFFTSLRVPSRDTTCFNFCKAVKTHNLYVDYQRSQLEQNNQNNQSNNNIPNYLENYFSKKEK